MIHHHPYLDRPLRSELDVARTNLSDALHNALRSHRLKPGVSFKNRKHKTIIAHWQRRVASLEGRS